MSTALSVTLGLLLGALAGAVHLAVTRWRVSLATTRGAHVALAAMPLGLVAVGVLVFVAAKISPTAACVTPNGMLAVRAVVLREARR